MFKNEPLWAVYTVLNQHYSHPTGRTTNIAQNLNLKCIISASLLCYYYLHSVFIFHFKKILQKTKTIPCLSVLTYYINTLEKLIHLKFINSV